MAKEQDLRRDIFAIQKGLAKVKRGSAELLEGIIETGRALSRAKTKVAHGQWGPWLRENFDAMSEDTSENYRRIYRLSSRPGFRAAAKNLSLEVLYALGRSGVTEEVQDATFARAAQGERITLTTLRYGTRVEDVVVRPQQVISVPTKHETLFVRAPFYRTEPVDDVERQTITIAQVERQSDTPTAAAMIDMRCGGGAAGRALRCLRDAIAAVEPNDLTTERLAALVADAEVEELLDGLDTLDAVLDELRQALQRRRGPQLRVVEPGEN